MSFSGRMHFSHIHLSATFRIHDKVNSGTVNFEEFKTLHQFLTDTQNK